MTRFPWKFDGLYSVCGPSGSFEEICTVTDKDDGRLMAAAPDMRAVLREIVGQSKPNTWGYDSAEVALRDDWRERARAALRKAEFIPSPLCAICDQIRELHPATHPWTAKDE